MPTLPNYDLFAGLHPETATLHHALAYAGVTAPHTSQPYSEAMILGVGGGLGAGYILWEFKEHNRRVIVLGFRKDWQYPVRYMQTVCDRLGVQASIFETGGRNAADKHLRSALDAGQAAITWVDRAHMPYYQLPDSLKGYAGHIVIVYGLDSDSIQLADLGPTALTVPASVFADARARISSYKNRVMVIHGLNDDAVDLPGAIMAGLQDCVAHLSGSSDSFSLPTLRKWGRLVDDGKNAKGWRKVFADRLGLYSTLTSIFESVVLAGHGGDGLRGLYADFLDEAAPLVERPALHDVAATYRDLAAQWVDLAESALPDMAPFAETKQLLRERQALRFAQGDAAMSAMQPLTDQLDAMSEELNLDFPLNDAGIDALFATLSTKLGAIYEAEVAAVRQLQSAAGL